MEPNASPDVNAGTPPVSGPAKSFLLSKTFWIALLGGIAVPLLKRAGLEFTDLQTQDTADAIVKLLTVAGVVWARSKATGPLQFGLGQGVVFIAFAAVTLLLGGCSALPLPKVKVGYHTPLFDVSYDGKTLKTDLHGELAPGLTVESR